MSTLLPDYIDSRTFLLDGSMGAMLLRLEMSEESMRGNRFERHPYQFRNNPDILNLTQPDVIARIHRQYLEAGADIIETNTINANRISQRQFGTPRFVKEINLRSAEIARGERDDFVSRHPERICFVAGSIGPSNIFPSGISDPIMRHEAYCALKEAYCEQALALIEGKVDIFLVETIFDSLSAQAAIDGINSANRQLGTDIRFMLSFTPSEESGKIASGENIEEIIGIFDKFHPAAIGFNCIPSSEESASLVRRLATLTQLPVVFYPSAGIPDNSGIYPYSASDFADVMQPLIEDGIVRIAGGCCGTTPEYISRIAKV